MVRTGQMTPDAPLALIHYNKETSDMSLPHVGAFRSVVWNALTNRPVAVSPARGVRVGADTEVSDEDVAAAVVEDFVDGVMLNLFWDGASWRLASHTQLHATGHYYGSRPFSELFWETFVGQGLALKDLDTAVCYSFVLQHPEERVVIAPAYGIPKLFLVGAYTIAADGSVATVDVGSKLAALAPVRHELGTLAAVRERVTAWGKRFRAGWQGVIIKTADGRRFKLRSAEYETARRLRGNQPNRGYLWLERWTEGRLPEYLKLYPEEEHDAMAIVATFKAETQQLYELYQKVYRRKELRLGDAPRKYRKLLWDAHKQNAGAYFPNTRAFMNKQDTARKLWLCRYEERYGSAAAAEEEKETVAATAEATE